MKSNGSRKIAPNVIWLQVRWGIQRYIVCIKNLKIHKEKNDRKATQPHLLVAKVGRSFLIQSKFGFYSRNQKHFSFVM